MQLLRKLFVKHYRRLAVGKQSSMSSFFLLFTPLAFLPSIALAQSSAPITYTLMAPLTGYLSGTPTLSQYLQGVVQVTIGLAGILAVIMLIYCGIKLMGTPSAGAKSEAKECIWNAIFGVLLAVGAWILLYTINPLLLSSDLALTDVAVAPAAGTAQPVAPQGRTYSWSTGSLCEPAERKIVLTVPPSYCTGTPPSADSVCCRFGDSPKWGVRLMYGSGGQRNRSRLRLHPVGGRWRRRGGRSTVRVCRKRRAEKSSVRFPQIVRERSSVPRCSSIITGGGEFHLMTASPVMMRVTPAW